MSLDLYSSYQRSICLQGAKKLWKKRIRGLTSPGSPGQRANDNPILNRSSGSLEPAVQAYATRLDWTDFFRVFGFFRGSNSSRIRVAGDARARRFVRVVVKNLFEYCGFLMLWWDIEDLSHPTNFDYKFRPRISTKPNQDSGGTSPSR